MNDIQCLSHTKWECKDHVVWIPKYRRKILSGQLRKNWGEVLHELAGGYLLEKRPVIFTSYLYYLQGNYYRVSLTVPRSDNQIRGSANVGVAPAATVFRLLKQGKVP